MVEDEQTIPNSEGFIEWLDQFPGPMGPCGAYRVEVLADIHHKRKLAESPTVVVRRAARTRSSKTKLQRRLALRRMPAITKKFIVGLKSTRDGWSTILPQKAATLLGKRIEVQVESLELNDALIDLLATILGNLPKLAARAEKAIKDYGGIEPLDDEVRIDRPRIWIAPETHGPNKWTIVVGVKGSDYAWHIEFTGARFSEIWGGD